MPAHHVYWKGLRLASQFSGAIESQSLIGANEMQAMHAVSECARGQVQHAELGGGGGLGDGEGGGGGLSCGHHL